MGNHARHHDHSIRCRWPSPLSPNALYLSNLDIATPILFCHLGWSQIFGQHIGQLYGGPCHRVARGSQPRESLLLRGYVSCSQCISRARCIMLHCNGTWSTKYCDGSFWDISCDRPCCNINTQVSQSELKGVGLCGFRSVWGQGGFFCSRSCPADPIGDARVRMLFTANSVLPKVKV